MKYREHPGYRDLLATARDRDPKAHVVCAATRDGGYSVALTTAALSVRVRAGTLDWAIDAVMAALDALPTATRKQRTMIGRLLMLNEDLERRPVVDGTTTGRPETVALLGIACTIADRHHGAMRAEELVQVEAERDGDAH